MKQTNISKAGVFLMALLWNEDKPKRFSFVIELVTCMLFVGLFVSLTHLYTLCRIKPLLFSQCLRILASLTCYELSLCVRGSACMAPLPVSSVCTLTASLLCTHTSFAKPAWFLVVSLCVVVFLTMPVCRLLSNALYC